MGCSAFKGGAPQQRREEEEVSNPPVVATTWATKTADAIPAAGSTSPTKDGQSSSHKKKGRSDMVLSDADDDDEIEIIYETSPKKQTQQQRPQEEAQVIPAAANAQEAPEFEADECDSRQKKLEPNSWMEQKPEQKQEPLSKSQQEAAAKLAESRKKFDNQRYQREQPTSEAVPFNAPSAQVSKEPSSAQGNKKIFHTPMASDMLFGLNQAQSSSTYATSQAANFEMIPGGIIDDYEPLQHVPISNKKKVGHDDVESTGFDVDDEKLMAEILEDFDS